MKRAEKVVEKKERGKGKRGGWGHGRLVDWNKGGGECDSERTKGRGVYLKLNI